MKITNVKFFETRRKGPVLAYANIVLEKNFIIRGITLLETEKRGRFISMPSRRLTKRYGRFREICHPLNNKIRNDITEAIFNAYDEFIKNKQ